MSLRLPSSHVNKSNDTVVPSTDLNKDQMPDQRRRQSWFTLRESLASAALFAPLWLSVLTGWAIGNTGNFGLFLMFPAVILITLIGAVGASKLGGDGVIYELLLCLYIPAAFVATVVLGGLGLYGLNPHIHL